MFGYVKADKAELRVWEYDTYKAIYCSLCKQLGKMYGPFSRLTLNYDFVFLALLSNSLKEGANTFYSKRCPFNPTKKCRFCDNAEKDLEIASAAAMVMLYYKLLDNIEDSRGIKKLFYKMLIPFFKLKSKKAAKLYPKIGKIVSDYISKQSALEKEGCKNLDEISAPTSDALGEIFSMCTENPDDKRVLKHLGYCIGKWIYILDAAADIEEDIASGSYNPLIYDMPKDADIKAYTKERTLPLLNTCICNADLSFELLNIKKYKGILENILYSGLKKSQEQVFNKGVK